MLLVAHDVNPLLGYLDQVIYLAGGRALARHGRARSSPRRTLSELYGAPIEVLRDRRRPPGRGRPARGPAPPRPPPRARWPAMSTHALAGPDRRRARAAHLPVHGQRARGGHDRRRAGRGRRLVHGAAPPELRRPHAVGDGVPRRGGRRARRAAHGARLLPGLRRRGAGRCGGRARSARAPRGYGTETATIATVQAVGLAAGFLFLSLNNAVLGGTETLLFGTFLGISRGQVLALLIVAVGALALRRRERTAAAARDDRPRGGAAPAACRSRSLDAGFLLVLGARGRRDQPDHGRAARVRAARRARRRGAAAHACARALGLAAERGVRARDRRGSALGIAYFSIYPVGFFVTSFAFARVPARPPHARRSRRRSG